MKLWLALLAFLCAPGAASAQTFDHLQIQLGAYGSTDSGGEKPVGVWFSTGPVNIGKKVAGTFSFAGSSCEGWAVSSLRTDVREDATTAWNIELTPVRVVRDAVTFRMRWARFAGLKQQLDQVPLDSGQSFRIPYEDVELTLRPGESFLVDSARVPAGAKTIDGRTCRGNASIRVLVDAYPSEDVDRRVVSADLWLIERLPDGGEARRGPMQSLRGVPNRPIKFYFDAVADANAALDIYGTVIVRPESGGMDVSVETRSRWGSNGPSRSVDVGTVVKPNEVVELRLPKLGNLGGPFANREFSIRIRTALVARP